MDVTDTTEKAERQLNYKEYYRQLSNDQTAANNETVNNDIEKFQKETLPKDPKLLYLGHLDSTLNLKYKNKVILEDQ